MFRAAPPLSLPLVWSADADRHDLRVVAVVPVACVASDDRIRRLYGIALLSSRYMTCRAVEIPTVRTVALTRRGSRQVTFPAAICPTAVCRNLGMVDNHGRAVTPFVRPGMVEHMLERVGH